MGGAILLMVTNLTVQLVAGAAGVVFLYMLYTALRVEWPHNYYSVSDFFQYRLSVSPSRYAFVRFAPVLFATFFVVAVLDRGGRGASLAVGTIVVGHFAMTSGRAVIGLVTGSGDRFARKAQFVGHLVVGVFVAIAGVLGAAFAQVTQLTRWIPSGEEIAGDMLFAVFAAVGGAFLISVSQRSSDGADAMFSNSIDRLDPELVKLAIDKSKQGDADVRLVLAVLIVENLQRPRWVRTLERAKEWFSAEGTYGVMQVRSSRAISDEDSIRKAVSTHFSGVAIGTDRHGEPSRLELQRAIRRYNGNRKFVEMVEELYHRLGYNESMRRRLQLD